MFVGFRKKYTKQLEIEWAAVVKAIKVSVMTEGLSSIPHHPP